jgi:murein DD-endopeptidase MepM/ murein hydrolase activator NlpD
LTYGNRTRARAGLASAIAVLAATGVAAAGAAGAGSGGVGMEGPAGTSSTGADGEFPVRAKHSYGDGLGAGRGHQGQDIMAKCGKPVVAAQPGRVSYRAYQGSGAGNYVVIAGKRKLADTVYMHLKRPAKVRKGERVDVGELLGRVGSTGRSTACHLHFEMWKGSWKRGGEPIDPKPYLRRWDRAS